MTEDFCLIFEFLLIAFGFDVVDASVFVCF